MATKSVPIAVIGMSCRFPGDATDPEKLWDLLCTGKDAWSDVPESRFRWQSFHHPDPERSGTSNHRGGHFLAQDLAAFDTKFFGDIGLREAETMDPCQRILLELAFEATENAGVLLEDFQGSDTGVYISTFNNDFARMQWKDSLEFAANSLTGVHQSVLANRLSYVFDLHGPSFVVDTACSGSLSALHCACQGLQQRESRLALAGSANLILDPDIMLSLSLQRVLNSDGKSYSFDERGAGYGRGEGAAMLLLKRLDDAVNDGDSIRAVIRGTGLGQDGRTAGISLPSSEAQAQLVRDVYRRAGLDPRDTPFVEAHGTGTLAGDRVEILSISQTFGAGKDEVYVGSIKANIGHTESTSGLAGLIKAIICIEKKQIPPNPRLQDVRPGLVPDQSRVNFCRTLQPWPHGRQLRASVNSFGYGGTNGHCIIEAWDNLCAHTSYSTSFKPSVVYEEKMTSEIPIETLQQTYLLPITARSEISLSRSVNAIEDWLKGKGHNQVHDLAYTLCCKRSLLSWRTILTVDMAANDVVGRITPSTNAIMAQRISAVPKTFFIFTGQGAQWYAMGRELLGISSVFTRSLHTSAELLKSFGAEWDLLTELNRSRETSRLDDSEIGQPTSTALQIALVDTLATLGVKPTAVVGHSSGEIAAAYAASILPQESAMQISYQRGLLTRNAKLLCKAEGAMIAVSLNEHDCASYLSQLVCGKVVVACSNSPTSTTLSGDLLAVEEAQNLLSRDGFTTHRLRVDTAYHSHHMVLVGDIYLKALAGVGGEKKLSSARFFSSVSGQEKTQGFGPEYWVQNLVSKVAYGQAIETLCGSYDLRGEDPANRHAFIEVGPHHALATATRDNVAQRCPDSGLLFLPTIVRTRNAEETLMSSLRSLSEHGHNVSLQKANSLSGREDHSRLVTDLTPYPWDHSSSYWREPRLSREYRFRQRAPHALLGVRLLGSSPTAPVWRCRISVDVLPWLQEHVIDGSPILPASAFICMAIEAKRQITQDVSPDLKVLSYTLKNITIYRPLRIPDSPRAVELQLSLASSQRNASSSLSLWDVFRISSVNDAGGWNEHCSGYVTVNRISKARSDDCGPSSKDYVFPDIARQHLMLLDRKATLRKSNPDELYGKLRSRGNSYGPSFATLHEFRSDESDAFGRFDVPALSSSSLQGTDQDFVVHPATLDTIMHTSIPLFINQHTSGSVVVATIERLIISGDYLHRAGSSLDVTAKLTPFGPSSALASISASSDTRFGARKLVVEVTGCKIKAIADANLKNTEFACVDQNYTLQWRVDVDLCPPQVYPSRRDRTALGPQPVAERDRAIFGVMKACVQSLADDKVSPSQWDTFAWIKQFVTLNEGITQEASNEWLNHASEFELSVLEISKNLAAILTGQVEIRTIIDESKIILGLISAEGLQDYHRSITEIVSDVAFKKRGLKILEYGIESTFAAKWLLQGLQSHWFVNISQYDVTDQSSTTLELAKIALSGHPSFVQFKTLSLAKDLTSQDFDTDTYDIIIASNDFGHRSSTDFALQSLRSLLKNRGRLLLLDNTVASPFLALASRMIKQPRTETLIRQITSSTGISTEWDLDLEAAGYHVAAIPISSYRGCTGAKDLLIAEAAQILTPTADPMVINVIVPQDFCTEHMDQVNGIIRVLQQFTSPATFLGPTTLRKASFQTGGINLVFDDRSCPILSSADEEDFSALKSLLSTTDARVLWINLPRQYDHYENQDHGLILGFIRTARVENKSLNSVTIDVYPDSRIKYIEIAYSIARQLRDSFIAPQDLRSDERDVRIQDGVSYIARVGPEFACNHHVRHALSLGDPEPTIFHQQQRPLKLLVETSGALDSMRFVDDFQALQELQASDIEIRVEAFGVNFKDVMVALGQLREDLSMVGECAGTVVRAGENFQNQFKPGDRVFALFGTPYASLSRAPGSCVFALPSNMSFIQGASTATVFLTAYYALVHLAQLKVGQTVLIHAAAGGVGQAAIQIAEFIGAKIYVTVSTEEKVIFIEKRFGIPRDRIFSSRDKSFRADVLHATSGRGVDVVLNSLSGDLLQESLDCVSQLGAFLEMGKFDINAGSNISLTAFEYGLRFFAIDLATLCRARPDVGRDCMAQIMTWIQADVCRPIEPLHVLPLRDIKDAFRALQSGLYMGKFVLEACKTSEVSAIPPPYVLPKLPLEQTYVIAGGLGGIGLEIGRALAARGASHIALLGRRRVSDEMRTSLELEFRRTRTALALIQVDITRSDCGKIARAALQEFPPVAGVFQCALVFENALIEQMSHDTYLSCVQPKAKGTSNILQAFSGPALKFCIMLSSMLSLFGSRGAAHYGAANAYLNAVALNDHGSRVRKTALILGPVKDVGALMQRHDAQKTLGIAQGYLPLAKEEILAMIDYVLESHQRLESPKVLITGFTNFPPSRTLNAYSTDDPILKHVLQKGSFDRIEGALTQGGDLPTHTIRSLILSTDRIDQACGFVRSHLAHKVATFTSLEADSITDDMSVADLGLDSLITIELKNWIARTFEATMQSIEILDHANLTTLSIEILQRSLLFSETEPNGTKVSTLVPEENSNTSNHIQDLGLASKGVKLPRQPVPDIQQLVSSYKAAVEAICSPEEHIRTSRLAQEFSEEIGLALCDRASIESDVALDGNWLTARNTQNKFLRRREPLHCHSSFFMSLPLTNGKQTAIDTAACLIGAAFGLMNDIETGVIGPKMLAGQDVHLSQMHNIFRTLREPGKVEDCVRKASSNERHIVILCRGHAYQVAFSAEVLDQTLASLDLKRALTLIVQNTLRAQFDASRLTADDRDTWAENREALGKLGSQNQQSLGAIESAAFVVCLDDVSPSSSQDRAFDTLFGKSGGSRWYDKTLQFIVSPDGTSSIVFEHSDIDGVCFRTVHQRIAQALRDNQVADATLESIAGDDKNGLDTSLDLETVAAASSDSGLTVSALPIDMDDALSKRVCTIQASLEHFATQFTYASFQLALGKHFWQIHKIPPSAGLQLTVQIANCLYFGHNPPAVDYISQAMFEGGRVAVAQTVWPSVVSLCSYVTKHPSFGGDDASASAARRTARDLFAAAIRTLTRATSQAIRGMAPTRLLQGLEYLLQPDERRPALFDDAVYQRHLVEVVMTDTLECDITDCGPAPMSEGAIWIHMESYEERAWLCAWTRRPSNIEDWRKCADAAAEIVRTIFGHEGSGSS